jgi:transposase
MRSISETGNSLDKQRFPLRIRKRNLCRRDSESFLRKNVHKIRQYSYLKYTEPELVEPLGN